MLKRHLLPLSIIFTGLVLFTTNDISSDKFSDDVITSEEMNAQKEAESNMIISRTLLRNKLGRNLTKQSPSKLVDFLEQGKLNNKILDTKPNLC